MRIENLQNENRKYAKSIGNFHVLEYVQDASVSPMNAMNQHDFFDFSGPYVFEPCYFFSSTNACTNNWFHMFSVICFFHDFLFE